MILTMRRGAAAAALLVLLLGACGDGSEGGDGADRSGKVEVVASFYPLAEIATVVGGDTVTVHNLTPAGTEPHDLEMTGKQVDRIEDADIVLFVGNGFQPAVEEAAERREPEPGEAVIDALRSVPREQLEGDDPHVWLAPMLLRSIVSRVGNALGAADPDNAVAYTERADAYRQQLLELHEELQAGLAICERTTVVTAHDAFHYLASHYGLETKAITGISPESEPEADRLDDLAAEIERTGATTVFTEELVSPKTAQALAREAGVKTAVLDPIEGLSDEKRRAGATYFTVMRENLAALRTALGCS